MFANDSEHRFIKHVVRPLAFALPLAIASGCAISVSIETHITASEASDDFEENPDDFEENPLAK